MCCDFFTTNVQMALNPRLSGEQNGEYIQNDEGGTRVRVPGRPAGNRDTTGLSNCLRVLRSG